MKFEGVTGVTQPKAPPRVSAVQAQYDKAIEALCGSGASAPEDQIAITVEPEGDVKSMKTRLTRAATRLGVKITAWYDPTTARLYAELKS